MKAWHVTAHGAPGDVMSLVDVADPQLPPGHVLCEVSAVALGLPDTLMCRDSYLLTPRLPFTPGQELTGTVVACGLGARLFEPGDRVLGVSSFITGHGALAERAVVPEEQLYRVGESMSAQQAAAFFIAYHTGYVGLVTRGKLVAGETLLVHGGAGGVGTAAIQLGKALGANVIATAGGPHKVAVCERMGADTVIDHRARDFVEAVREATDMRGVDLVYDPVGGDTYERSFECMAMLGRILPIGFASGRWGRAPMDLVLMNNLSIVGVLPNGFGRVAMERNHDALLDLFERGALRPHIDATVGFEEVPVALQRVADRDSVGRIVVRVGGGSDGTGP
ncbi:MAG: NADPH:quinone oxidoreductase family protein [Myxococcales bacterium]|nr:MAG: NADPH:quinone oxidoreductase family protein [Myxococcales bacterium]